MPSQYTHQEQTMRDEIPAQVLEHQRGSLRTTIVRHLAPGGKMKHGKKALASSSYPCQSALQDSWKLTKSILGAGKVRNYGHNDIPFEMIDHHLPARQSLHVTLVLLHVRARSWQPLEAARLRWQSLPESIDPATGVVYMDGTDPEWHTAKE